MFLNLFIYIFYLFIYTCFYLYTYIYIYICTYVHVFWKILGLSLVFPSNPTSRVAASGGMQRGGMAVSLLGPWGSLLGPLVINENDENGDSMVIIFHIVF